MIKIIRAIDADAKELCALGRRTFVETFEKDNSAEDMASYLAATFSPEKQRQEILDPDRIIEIARVDGEAAGFLHLLMSEPDPSVQGDQPVELLRLYVDSRWHGKGVGAALMSRAIELARQEGFQTLWLGVWENNFRAQAFYRKYGFSVVGKHAFQLGTDDQIDLIMALSISI